jgi:hypothetical protein
MGVWRTAAAELELCFFDRCENMPGIGKDSRQSRLSLGKQWNMSQVMSSIRQFLYDRKFRIQRNQLDPKVQEALVWLISQGLTAEPRKAKDTVNADTKQTLKLLAEIVTSLWRVRRKLAQGSEDGANKIISRHIESAFDTLTAAKVELKDHTGEKYVSGMSLKVVAFQPNPELKFEKITETIKPTIIYRGILLQNGEVIVEKPDNQPARQEFDDK